MTALLLLSIGGPGMLAALLLVRSPARSALLRLAPWAALPAFAVALWAPAIRIDAPYLLLGVRLELDGLGRVFLLLSAALWLAAGIYARSDVADEARARFWVVYLLSMSGNLGLTVAQDLGSFFLFFALMTFAAYGLVVHDGGEEALRAGRIYIGLAVLGEAMLLVGGAVAASSAPSVLAGDLAPAIARSPLRDLSTGLLLAGFGAKAGLLPLHVWLPLAHPVAPTPASAVLSGSMIKAGLLGWLRFLPLGEVGLPAWGGVVIALGLAGAFLGAVAGVTQDDPKATLAYSSISQMGVMTTGVGLALLSPELSGAALSALAVYSLHHALVKGALFLGVGIAAARASGRRMRALVAVGIVFSAVSMAGAPLTSGSTAKHYLKEVTHDAPELWMPRLDLLISCTAGGTSLLMARFLWLVLPRIGENAHQRLSLGLLGPWVALLAGTATLHWLLPSIRDLGLESAQLPDAASAWSSTWPILVSAAAAAAVLLLIRHTRFAASRFRIPKGDLLLPVESAALGMWHRMAPLPIATPPDPVGWIACNWYDVYAHQERWEALLHQELRITRWRTAGVLFLLIGALLYALFAGG